MMDDGSRVTDWCERVADAIGEGRFLEDPALWRPHVETCDICQASVAGLFALREQIRQAGLESPVADPVSPDEGIRTIESAFRRYRRGRTLRNTSICLIVGTLTAVGVGFAWRGDPPPMERPAAYARRLYDTIFAVGKPADYGRLKRDEALRAEFVRALDHPSSYVRRTAMSGLLQSGVTIDASRIERVLSEWHEDLDSPVTLASTSDDARAITDALVRQRTATVRAALAGLAIPAQPGARRVSSDTIVRYLSDPEADIRKEALRALTADPAFMPGTQVENRFRSDPDIDVRTFAGRLLIVRHGEAGAATVVDRLRRDPDDALETRLIPSIGKYPAGLELARERVASEATDIALALAHSTTIFRSGTKAPPVALIDRALRAATPASFEALAMLVCETDWSSYRGRLQELWRGIEKDRRSYGGALLVQWDMRAPRDESRIELALEICEADRQRGERAAVTTLTHDKNATIRERAERLLASWSK